MTAVTTPHPFLNLEKSQRLAVAKELKEVEGFGDHFETAVKNMRDGTVPTPGALAVMNALDAKAVEILEKPVVDPWRKEGQTINDITGYLSLAQKGCVIGSGGALVVSLLYRSNRLFVVASLCVACAFLALKAIASSWENAFHEVGIKLKKLSWRNQNEFSQEVVAIYEGLAKANYLTKVYLGSSTAEPIERLREQLFAFKSLRSVVLRLVGVRTAVSACVEQDKFFFNKFAKITRQGLKVSVGVAFLAASFTYYASIQRAYMMACIGVVQVVGALAISRELFALQKYSKRIFLATDDTYTQKCQELIQQSWFINRLGETPLTMRAEVVNPLDAILKLVPGWRDDAEK